MGLRTSCASNRQPDLCHPLGTPPCCDRAGNSCKHIFAIKAKYADFYVTFLAGRVDGSASAAARKKIENFAADWRIELLLGVIWLAVIASFGAYGLMFYLIRTRAATRVSALQ